MPSSVLAPGRFSSLLQLSVTEVYLGENTPFTKTSAEASKIISGLCAGTLFSEWDYTV